MAANEECPAFIGGVATGFVIGIVIGLGIGIALIDRDWEKAAITHECAHYDPATGEFTWNESEPSHE